jgi:predicted membrane-bound dolichyl-phosphate-mannose-protein mannosyltransferase
MADSTSSASPLAFLSDFPLSPYLGVDWLAMLLTFIAIYLIGNKSVYGFYLMILGNIAWIALGILSQSLAMIIANALFAAMNIRAIYLWSQPEEENS